MCTATRVNDRSSATYVVRVSHWHPRWIHIRERTPLISHSTAYFARRHSIRRTLWSHITLHHTPSLEEFLCCKMLLGRELNIAKYFMQILIRFGSWKNRNIKKVYGVCQYLYTCIKRKTLWVLIKRNLFPYFGWKLTVSHKPYRNFQSAIHFMIHVDDMCSVLRTHIIKLNCFSFHCNKNSHQLYFTLPYVVKFLFFS